jgi:hypothetical protein
LKPKGGKRPGAGRPKGCKNRKTEERLEHLKLLAAAGITPLEYMLATLRDPKEEPDRRLDAAKSAAPYVHPRLAQTDISVSGDLRFLTDQAIEDELGDLLKDPEIADVVARASRKG